ncbi:putative transcriptional regulator [Cerasibacillus quisquiliarum]|uniref:Transcriptional regulator n=1 Tax=Cerasibacillus quisquiliarum TaxID=227865 RepID=A0A511UYT4_9BACI|nr:helix-turn-helix transcriptional regulator [Cerasibacillus quisquiliarum]MBB5146193.1 putative transcriptional regulator [Cerasibacillus quisquiliarum]GEN30928.1 transcriptional regulator [Cerasibacillus quisquiliarum]
MKRGKVKNNIRNVRRMMDITQQDLADQVGVHRQTILAIEKQKYEPTIGIVLALSKALNQPVENLFFWDEENE